MMAEYFSGLLVESCFSGDNSHICEMRKVFLTGVHWRGPQGSGHGRRMISMQVSPEGRAPPIPPKTGSAFFFIAQEPDRPRVYGL
jgi:hypothetical protein